MNHDAIASHRAKGVEAHVGFQLSTDLQTDEALHALFGVAIGAIATYAIARKKNAAPAAVTERAEFIELERGKDGRYQWYSPLAESVVYNYSGDPWGSTVYFDRTENAPRIELPRRSDRNLPR